MQRTNSQIVDEADFQKVGDLLNHIEQQRDLHILFACESGSRAWGFASVDSDYDVRFIYVRPIREYLRLRPLKDAFDLPSAGLIDAAGWDIRKTAELLWRSNPPLLEWIDSPIIYFADNQINRQLRQFRELYFDAKKSTFHYLSMAGGVWRQYIEGETRPVRKKYLYVLRPLACVRFITQHQCQPPTRFEDVLAAIDWPDEVMQRVNELVERKKQAEELSAADAEPLLNEYISRWLADAESMAHTLPVGTSSIEPLDEFINEVIRKYDRYRRGRRCAPGVPVLPKTTHRKTLGSFPI